MKRFVPRQFCVVAVAALAACSGGGGSTGDAQPAGGDFVVERTDPVNGAIIYLNDPINIDFSAPVDLDSASLTTVSFQALDQNGNPVQDMVTGNFNLATRPGDTQPGRRLQFVPRFPTNNTFSDGGFRAGRSYLVSLVGGNSPSTVLRGANGKQLGQPITFRFSTRDGTQPAQLFRNPLAGGPERTGLEVTTAASLDAVPLALFGAPPLEVRMHFDQALNPADTNVPVNLDTDPIVRNESLKGRVFLEYQDPDDVPGVYTWIPADVEIERNDLDGSTLALRPVGVLPNNALVRVIAEPTLEDIAGESNVASPTFNRVFGEFRTQAAFEQQWDAIIESFDTIGSVNLAAAFPESTAEVGPGYLKAGFAFEGTPTLRDYAPNTAEVVLNTAFTQIAPVTGLPFTVTGGVFNFRNVTIPQGVLVRGTGPNPMVWLCSGKFTVAGTLTVRGGDGARVDTLNSANFAKAGGVAGPAGGNGGDGTPSATLRDTRGGNGRGPLQAAGKGGRGGYLACASGCYTGSSYNGTGGGSGGGGGTLATQGDPFYIGGPPAPNPNVAPTANTAFQQKQGYGGSGCGGGSGSRSAFLTGGEPGDKVFTDTRRDNDFWGNGIRLDGTPLRITGELTQPVGGGGGGGGGDTVSPGSTCTSGLPANDFSGGGGGGGGGVLIVKALEDITILSTGKIVADGGHGGGGEQVGACGEAGGGGGGAGGMVILMSAKEIRIEAHGTQSTNPAGFRAVYHRPTGTGTEPYPPGWTAANYPYLDKDYNFAISADGGVCTTGGFGAVNITNKYPAAGATPTAGSQYDTEPLGALGGLGIIQLMVPPGPTEVNDGTNTRLDDNINFWLPGQLGLTNVPPALSGQEKRQLLAWRGFPDAANVFRDDNGNPTNIGTNEGDMRPAPILLPVPFSTKSRAQSKWIDTGTTKRRPLAAPDEGARGIVTSGGAQVGPIYQFAGTEPGTGYVDYEPLGTTGVRIKYPPIVGDTSVASAIAGVDYLGAPAYQFTLASPVLGEANRLAQYEVEVLNAQGSVLGSFRIFSHTDRDLIVDAGSGVLPNNIAQARVLAKFFKIVTSGAEGLGPVRIDQLPNEDPEAVPLTNLRIGFAFHNDAPFVQGLETDPARFPNATDTYTYDLDPTTNTALQAWLTANGAPRYVQWDVLFDLSYDLPGALGDGRALSPSTPRPELHFLRLPFRF